MSTRWFVVTIIIISILILCAGTGYLGYSFHRYELKIDEENYNFIQGKSEGEKIGYSRGYSEGYKIGLKEAQGYSLRDPTYQEMKEFLAHDTTDKFAYDKEKYVCTDFTAEVNNNAEKLGLRCATVYIIYPETGHSIIAFNTVDRGLIFIEPQFDKEVSLVIGKSYSEINGFIKPQDFNDTIVRYLIMW